MHIKLSHSSDFESIGNFCWIVIDIEVKDSFELAFNESFLNIGIRKIH